MARRYKSSNAKMLQQICHDYMAEHGVESVDPDDLASWAMATGRWQERPYDAHKRCRRELADAMRDEHFTDPQGREVRRMHPDRVLKGDNYAWEWHEIYHMPAAKFRASITHRRDGVLAGLKQMKTDQDSWNDNNVHGATLPLFDADFNPDLEEMDQPDDHWPDEDPDSDDDDS